MHESLREAVLKPLWLDNPARPDPLSPLVGEAQVDLAIIGGGYTGLWTALLAKERDPSRSVVILEGGQCGDQASGRNGGFVSASLTHGFGNGLERWPDELDTLERLGRENLAEMGETIKRLGIDCGWKMSGELEIATMPHQVAELVELAEELTKHGIPHEELSGEQVRERLDSPTYLSGIFYPDETALVEPAKLVWGLRRACLEAGVQIYEGSMVSSMKRLAGRVQLTTAAGVLRADQVALATNAFPPLLRRLSLMTVPVYDYVLATEPLTPEQLASIGWDGREGVGDFANLFHYYRLTSDNRILWGGYDAVYHYGSKISADLEGEGRTHTLLAEQFFETFPQLAGVRFSHRWAGVIDTCTRFSAFFGTAWDGRVAYALGYTGLGVGATRFGAQVMLDFLEGKSTERTRLEMVRSKPLPFPPEPFRYVGINWMTRSLESSDAHEGRRNLFLRSMDRLGFGFDS